MLRNKHVHYNLLPTHPILVSYLKPYSRKQGINHVKDMASEKQWLHPESSVKRRAKGSSTLQEGDRELGAEGLCKGGRREDDAELQERNSTAGKILQDQEILLRKSK